MKNCFDVPSYIGAERPEASSKTSAYADVQELKDFLSQLKGKKFMLDCGHKVTFGYFLGNDITVRNGKILKIICAECGY